MHNQPKNNEQEWLSRMVETRRAIHRRPELGLDCHATAGHIRARLLEMGLEARPGGAKSGLLCDLHFSAGRLVTSRAGASPAILLRADMDGLPLVETGTAAKQGGYASESAAAMHACGHDGHVAMLLGAAELLLAQPPADGSVRLMFQPGEEGPGGAAPMIEAGALDGINRAFGLHLWNRFSAGTLAICPGPAMAACDEFAITLEGPGGHGAHPSETRDPVLAAGQLITTLHTIVPRDIPPEESAVLTVGAIHGGTAFNIIPSEVLLRGTLRSFEPAVRDRLAQRVHEMANGVAALFGLRARVDILRGYPALVNDPGLARRTAEWARTLTGVESIVVPKAEMGAEDFAYIAARVPSLFIFVGARPAASAADSMAGGHHSPTFDIDEAALPLGARLLHGLARQELTHAA